MQPVTAIPQPVESLRGGDPALSLTLAPLFLHSQPRAGNAAMHYARDGEWHLMSYDELRTTVRELALGLIALGIEPGDRVAILCSTRHEWTLADGGILCAGATVVPIYMTNSPEECQYVLAHSGARAVFCENAEQLAKVAAVRDRCPDLEHVIAFEDAAGDSESLEALRKRGATVDPEALDAALARISPDAIATIVYTSGTTGPPKGCVLTHANCLATIDMYAKQLVYGDEIVVFLFLPLAHSLARVTQLVTFRLGGTLAFWRGDAKLVLEDVAITRPTHFPSVPRVFEKIYTRAVAGVADASPLKRAAFGMALDSGRRMREAELLGVPVGRLARARHRIVDRLVLAKVRALFGGRVQQALTGAAPIGAEVLEFFHACGITVFEGYGMTETCAAATLNTPGQLRIGTVGAPLPGVEVKVAADGEILMRGPNVFCGYWHDDEATHQIIDQDGWLRSGDLGSIDQDGYLRITGRKKDIIITSSGKNITPSNLESALRETRWISEAVVFGDRRPYLVAILTLDPDEAPALAEKCGVLPDLAAMTRDPKVLAELSRTVDEVNNRFARIEQIKRFAVLDHDLTQASGEMTPTLKVKRQNVYDRYAEVFDGLYEEP